jgi:hypothetical protein
VSDLAEIRIVLAGVAQQIGSAYEHAELARARITDAVAVLDGLGEHRSEPILPEVLTRAADELERGLGFISGGAAAVADIDARL